MIIDAILGVLVYGDASLRAGNLDNKDTFVSQLRSLRAIPNDGSYENFDTAVRAALHDFRTIKSGTQVALWVNEVVALQATELPSPTTKPAVEERGKVLQFIPRKK